MPEPRVYMRHVRMIRRPGGRPLCVDGIELWCARHEIDISVLINEGIDGERALEIGDSFATKALGFARSEASDGEQ